MTTTFVRIAVAVGVIVILVLTLVPGAGRAALSTRSQEREQVTPSKIIRLFDAILRKPMRQDQRRSVRLDDGP